MSPLYYISSPQGLLTSYVSEQNIFQYIISCDFIAIICNKKQAQQTLLPHMRHGNEGKEVELSPWKEGWKLRLESCLTSKQAHRLGGWELGSPSSSVLEKDRHILWSNPCFRAEASGSQRRRVVCLEPLTDPSA